MILIEVEVVLFEVEVVLEFEVVIESFFPDLTITLDLHAIV